MHQLRFFSRQAAKNAKNAKRLSLRKVGVGDRYLSGKRYLSPDSDPWLVRWQVHLLEVIGNELEVIVGVVEKVYVIGFEFVGIDIALTAP